MIEQLPRNSPIKDRLLAYSMPEPNTGCWLWLAADILGYGVLKVSGKMQKAHRLSYQEFVGPISDGLLVCHRCDTPACINPDHLFLGTVADNTHDMLAKNRQKYAPAKGEASGGAKLTADQVLEVVEHLEHGHMTQTDIGEVYGVSQSTISAIKCGLYWADVSGLAGKSE